MKNHRLTMSFKNITYTKTSDGWALVKNLEIGKKATVVCTFAEGHEPSTDDVFSMIVGLSNQDSE